MYVLVTFRLQKSGVKRGLLSLSAGHLKMTVLSCLNSPIQLTMEFNSEVYSDCFTSVFMHWFIFRLYKSFNLVIK